MAETQSFTDPRTGRTLHGDVAASARHRYEREQAEAEQAATVRAVARLGVWLAAQQARGTQSGPDILLNALGREDALRILRLAGQDAAQIAARWHAEEPSRPAETKTSMFDLMPDHHPLYVEAQLRGGDVLGALREIARDRTVPPLCAQRAEMALSLHGSGKIPNVGDALEAAPAALARLRRELAEHGAVLAPPLGVAEGPGGVPLQRSIEHRDVAELGSEVV